ncbi:MAG: hypothetical protein SFX72_14805, partial [Isosphaeraceae bacterium]|nr:hypothetical protein [Isosphaeraceae bacterium]
MLPRARAISARTGGAVGRWGSVGQAEIAEEPSVRGELGDLGSRFLDRSPSSGPLAGDAEMGSFRELSGGGTGPGGSLTRAA